MGRARIAVSAFAAMSLAGCASFSPDAGMSVVDSVAATALGQEAHRIDTGPAADAARARVRRLLASPLSADAAVQIALLNNKGLQAAYNELGIAEAARVEASLPPNPTFSLTRVSTPVELDVENRIVGDILALATLPVRSEIAANRFRQAQLDAALATLRAGLEARRAWYRTVASRQLASFLGHASAAAEASAKLATELGRTGALNKLDQARDQSFHLELSAQLATARQQAESEREALIRAIGLSGEDLRFKLPEALPGLPRRPENLPGIETAAIRRRVDLQIARIEVEALAKSYGLTRATRFINLLDVAGVSRTQRETGIAQGTGGGVEVEFQVPIFDLGEVRMRQAGEAYMEAVNRLAQKAVNVRSEARDAYRLYRSTYDIAASYRNRILPLREVITNETMLRYGAMQIDVFTLLTEVRQRIAVNIAAIEAQRDFWLASADLTAAVAGGGAAGNANTAPRVAVDSAASPGE
ncbi:MAG: TolC family protein [Bradyrhizobiaceae bacterium]|nr:TolC family protein [Bradyrhizobiaceae bacterium]